MKPMTEMLNPVLDFVRRKIEDNGGVPSMVDTVDSYASDGIDELTKKVPTLKEETPVFIEETKSSLNYYWAEIYNYAMTFDLFKMVVMIFAVFLDISFDEKLPEKKQTDQFPKKEINELQKANTKIKVKSKKVTIEGTKKLNFFSKVQVHAKVKEANKQNSEITNIAEETENQKIVENNNTKIVETVTDDKNRFETELVNESNPVKTLTNEKEEQIKMYDKSEKLAMSNDQLSDISETDSILKNSPKPKKMKKNISKVFLHKKKTGEFEKQNELQLTLTI